jgi:hypothetical protein
VGQDGSSKHRGERMTDCPQQKITKNNNNDNGNNYIYVILYFGCILSLFLLVLFYVLAHKKVIL